MKEMYISGYNKLEIKSLDSEDFTLTMAGKNDGYADMNIQNLNLILEGSSSLELEGEGDFFEAKLTGISDLEARYYKANEVDISTSGTSKAHINARMKLTAKETGISKVTYSGNPKEVEELGD